MFPMLSSSFQGQKGLESNLANTLNLGGYTQEHTDTFELKSHLKSFPVIYLRNHLCQSSFVICTYVATLINELLSK